MRTRAYVTAAIFVCAISGCMNASTDDDGVVAVDQQRIDSATAPGSLDQWFVDTMIPDLQRSVQVAQLAGTQAQSEDLRQFAQQFAAIQSANLQQLQSLQANLPTVEANSPPVGANFPSVEFPALPELPSFPQVTFPSSVPSQIPLPQDPGLGAWDY